MERTHSRRRRPGRAIPRGAFTGARGRAIRRLIGVGALLVLGGTAPAMAGVYMYVDDRGVTHFTNDPRGDRRFQPVALRRQLSRPVPKYRTPKSKKYDPLITRAAYRQGLPPALVKAVIAAESAFDSQAVSRAGAQGLMQLMPATAASLGVNNAFEPAQNVAGGSAYLRKMIDRYGDLSRALAAYNAGPTAVDRYGGIPPYRETKAYVDRVLTYYRRYHGDFPR